MDDAARSEGPEWVLVQAVRVLHRRGMESLRALPYHYATGHWRLQLYAGGREVFGYSSAMRWGFAGRPEAEPTDAEGAADAIRSFLDEEAREAAARPDPGYAFWYSELLDRCRPGHPPSMWDDYGDSVRSGYLRIAGRAGPERFPLPPGPSPREYGRAAQPGV